jgi:tetratricopeptide (TPR) repeat protein
MKEKQRAQTEKRSSARLRYFLAGLAILLVTSACDAQTRRKLAILKGHAVQVGGANHLIPVGAVIDGAPEVRYEAMDAGFAPAQPVSTPAQALIEVLRQAEVSLRRRDYVAVISAAQQALIADLNNGVAHRFLYEAYFHRHDSDRSNQARDNALRLLKTPKDAMEYEARGAVYLVTDGQRAIADYSEAIRLDPKYAVAYLGRGLAYAYKKEYDRAIADYGEAIKFDPKYAVAYYSRGRSYAYKREYDQAIADYSEAIRLDPKYAGTYSYRAEAYRQIGREDLAKADESTAKGLSGK